MSDSIQYKAKHSASTGTATDHDSLPQTMEVGDQKEFNDAYAKWAKKNGIRSGGWGANKGETFNYGNKSDD